MELRDYQTKAIKAVNNHLSKGKNKPVLVLATGTGKTIIFAHIVADRIKQTGKKALILAHREELLVQARDKLLLVDPHLKIGIEKAGQYASDDCNVIVASVPSIGQKDSERIKRFKPDEFSTIICDEFHHFSSDTNKNVLRYFGVLKSESDWNKDCLLLGVTATPSRTDNKGIDRIADSVVFDYPILEAIQDGWLARIRAFRVTTETSLEGVHTLAGDFNQGELGDAINNLERNNLIVKTYLDKFNQKQALVFAIDVSHGEALYLAFTDKGVEARYLDGSTPRDKRAEILKDFHEKRVHVVVNCMVLTEGYDNDSIDVIMMARPTKSGILYSQMLGRGTRLHKDKPYLALVDFCDNTLKHSVKTSASLLGFDDDIDFKGRDVVSSLDDLNKILELDPNYNLSKLDFDRLAYVFEEIDVLGGLDIPPELATFTNYSWLKYNDNFKISLGDHKHILVKQEITGEWLAIFQSWDQETRLSETKHIATRNALKDIISASDEFTRITYPKSLGLIDMRMPWRHQPPSSSQLATLQARGVSEKVLQQLDKGRAAQLLGKLFNSRMKPQPKIIAKQERLF